MRVVSVPGRLVRHWVTGRVIDEGGIIHDPLCVTTAYYLRHGDLKLVNDDGSDIAPEAAPEPDPAPVSQVAPAPTKAAPAAKPAAE